MIARGFFIYLGIALCAAGELRAVQRVEQQSFAVRPGCLVKIDTYRGLINIVPGTGNEVKIVVRSNLPAEKPESASAVLDGFELKASNQNNVVQITARNPRDSGVRFTWSKDLRPEIEFTVEVPAHCDLDLLTKDGGITVGNLRGNLKARTENGTIFFRQIEGDVDAFTPNGDVTVSRCTGSVNLRAVQGDIRVGTVGGRARMETVNGDIEVLSSYAAIQATTSVGDVRVGFAQLDEKSKIQTAIGNITAKINPAMRFLINATSSWGKVTSGFASDAQLGSRVHGQLTGQYNGGGPLIELKASGGHIAIAPGEPLFPL